MIRRQGQHRRQRSASWRVRTASWVAPVWIENPRGWLGSTPLGLAAEVLLWVACGFIVSLLLLGLALLVIGGFT